jgi:agmatinase
MKNYYFINGYGESKSSRGAINKALEISLLSQCRPLIHTNFLSKDAMFLDRSQVVQTGETVDVILETAEGSMGSIITAGIVLGDLYKNGKKERTIVCKKSGQFSKEELETFLSKELKTIGEEFTGAEYEIRNIKSRFESLEVKNEHGSVLVGIGFTDKYIPIELNHPELPPFLGKQADYYSARYAVIPVLYEHPVQFKERYAPLQILKASKFMEDYDLETDQQLSRVGVHTSDALVSTETPHVFVQKVEEVTARFLKEEKLPVFIGEDQTLTIGALRAVKEIRGSFSLLHFGSSTQLRSSFDGSSFSQACAIKKGLEYAKDVVQVGIRSTSNREKKELQYDKIFFASDIFDEKDDHWMEDVIEELSQEIVYITLDFSVFDPSVIMSKKPEPMGLSYAKVIKLLKLVARKKKIVGLDFVGLNPQEGELSSELAAARLIYQTLCFLTKN